VNKDALWQMAGEQRGVNRPMSSARDDIALMVDMLPWAIIENNLGARHRKQSQNPIPLAMREAHMAQHVE
jgi:hypothetical protein